MVQVKTVHCIELHILCFVAYLFLYGCETWFLTLREEYKLGVFGNRMLGIFGQKCFNYRLYILVPVFHTVC